MHISHCSIPEDDEIRVEYARGVPKSAKSPFLITFYPPSNFRMTFFATGLRARLICAIELGIRPAGRMRLNGRLLL